MSVKYADLNFMGYPAVREELRYEFRRHRSEAKVCSCTRCLNHLDSNWVAVRSPEGHHLADHMICSWCLADRIPLIRKNIQDDLTTLEYDTILVLLIRGTELFF